MVIAEICRIIWKIIVQIKQDQVFSPLGPISAHTSPPQCLWSKGVHAVTLNTVFRSRVKVIPDLIKILWQYHWYSPLSPICSYFTYRVLLCKECAVIFNHFPRFNVKVIADLFTICFRTIYNSLPLAQYCRLN